MYTLATVMSKSSPKSPAILLRRARTVAGLRLIHLAERLGRPVPENLRRDKGWVGRLLEDTLGADGGNASAADFAHLGIELKTIPVDRSGTPQETTFVCSVPLASPDETDWESSCARAKLASVLWVPILCEPELPIAHRLVGSPLLWTPSDSEESLLATDWRNHLDTIRQGYVDKITAHDGRVMQIRPKGATAQSRTWSIGPDGQSIMTNPRAFYLRTSFTAAILQRNFAIG